MTIAALILSGSAVTAAPAAVPPIPVPSGAVVTWLDTVQNVPGPSGLTYRYRFVMPDLATRVPATVGPASDDLTDEDRAELDNLGRESPATTPGAEAEAEMVSPEELDLPDFKPEDFSAEAEDASDSAAAATMGGGSGLTPAPLPPDPDLVLQDPVHDDIIWLCQNWVLPRLAPPAPLPAQIIISLADRATVFGEADGEALQLFEAFSITPDRKSCQWEAW